MQTSEAFLSAVLCSLIKLKLHFYASGTEKPAVSETFCFRVSPFMSEPVSLSVSLCIPQNLVNTVSQKLMKGSLPRFGHGCIWVHRYAD